MQSNEIQEQFDALAEDYDTTKKKNAYYFETLIQVFRKYITHLQDPLLEIGCGTGEILAQVTHAPSQGIDLSPKMIELAQLKYPNHRFSCQRLGFIQLEQR